MLKIEEQILNTNFWIKNNLNTDLNAYEMVDQATALNNARLMGEQIDPRTFDRLQESWSIRKKANSERGLEEAYLATHICENVVEGGLKDTHLSIYAIEVLKKIAAIDLYFAQEKRNNNTLEYNNIAEYLFVCENYEKLKKENNYPYIIDTYFERFSAIVRGINIHLVDSTKEILNNKPYHI